MTPDTDPRCVAFADDALVAAGSIHEVAVATKELVDRSTPGRLLVFDASTSAPVELDLRGSVADVLARYPATYASESVESSSAPKRRGRPRLGVVSKEVTLLPRHWAWLGTQPGGASATLRRLVEHARKDGATDDRVRRSQDATYRFMHAALGDATGFEEAVRALYVGDADRFDTESASWPADLRSHARALAEDAFANTTATDRNG